MVTDDSVLLSDGVISEWADLFNTTGGFKAVCRFITSGVSTSSNGNSNGNVTTNSITNDEIPKNKAIQKNSTTMHQDGKQSKMPRQGWKALLRILRVCLSRDPSLVKESVNLSGPLMNIVLNDKEQQQEHEEEEEEEETINENKNSGKDDMIDATLDGKYSSEGAAREWSTVVIVIVIFIS